MNERTWKIGKGLTRKTMALLLAVCMVCTMSPPLMAAAQVTDSGEVTTGTGDGAADSGMPLLGAPRAVDTFTAEINVGDNPIDCTFKVLTEPAGGNGTVQVGDDSYSGAVDKSSAGALTIPETVTNEDSVYDVTKIGKFAFNSCKNLTEMVIPNNVKEIGERSFEGCYTMATLTLGSGVETIQKEAFSNCSELTRVTIPNSVKTIGEKAFFSCSKLKTLNLGNGVETIGDEAFHESKGLEGTLIIPKSVKTIGAHAFHAETIQSTDSNEITSLVFEPDSMLETIGAYAFSNFQKITSVTIPKSVTTIGECAFIRCGALASFFVDAGNTNYVSEDDALYNFGKTELIYHAMAKAAENFVIPSSVKEISSFAFYQCEKLTGALTIPNSVETIGEYAFDSCTGLDGALTLGSGVKTIGEFAFCYCKGLTGTLTIPNNVTTIGKSAFNGCSKFDALTISTEITVIAEDTFGYCKGLTSVTIPDKVTSIGVTAFETCEGLTSVTIPDKVTIIDGEAFKDCTSLTSVTILDTDSNAPTLGNYAFYGCTVLNTFRVPAATPPTSNAYGVFEGVPHHNPLVYLDTNGNDIADDEAQLDAAAARYKDEDDGNPNDNSWYVWAIKPPEAVANLDLTDNLSAPAVGGIPASTITADSQYTGEVSWSPAHNPFQVNTTYTATVTLTAEEGYTFTGVTANFTYNGATSVTSLAGSGNTMVVTIVFPAAQAPVLVTGINIGNDFSLPKDETKVLTATVTPASATNKAVTWESNKTTVATVNASGLVTAIAEGTAKITATAKDGSGKSASCTVTVTKKDAGAITVTGVTVAPAAATIEAGKTAQLTAAVAPANATNKGVTWKSNNHSVATVDERGLVTAVAEGTAKITATTADGGKTAFCTVTVTKKDAGAITVTGVTVTPTAASIEAGKTAKLTATVAPANATNKAVTWASDKTTVATVNASGLVTAIAEGTATITATAKDGSGKSGSCTVTVTKKDAGTITVTGVTVTPAAASIEAGKTQQLTATVAPAGATNKAVTWATDKASVTTVNASGLVTAVAEGTAKITATTADGGKTAFCTVTVTKKEAETGAITGTVTDEKGSVVPGVTMEVRVGDTESGELKGSKATTDADGKYTIASLEYGTYTLVARKDPQVITGIIEIKAPSLTKNIQLPNGSKNTVVEVKPSAPTVAVEDLEKTFTDADDALIKDALAKITIKLVVDKLPSVPAGETALVNGKLGDKTLGLTLDAKLLKTITGTANDDVENKPITDTNGKTIKVVLQIPADLQGQSPYSVIRVHGSSADTLAAAYDAAYQTLTFETDKFSTYAIAYTKADNTPPPSGSNGGGGGSSDDRQNDFWDNAADKIIGAGEGETIKIIAGDYDKMPESVMDALRENPDVTLVIDRNGGDPIVIPAGKAQPNDPGRIYWQLSLLAELYRGIEFVETPIGSKTNPETGGPGYIEYADGKQIPVTGGVTQLEAPAIGNAPDANTPNAQAIVTPPTAGFEPDAYAGTTDAAAASGTVCKLCRVCPTFLGICLFIWLAIIALASIGGILLWKKRQIGK